MRLTCIVAFNPLPDSRILASQSLSGSPTTPPGWPRAGAQAKVPFQSWGCCRPSSFQVLGTPGVGQVCLSVSLSHDPLVSASAHSLLSLSWSSAPFSPFHPGCNWGYHPCPRTVQRARPAPQPLVMVAQNQGSLWPLPGGGHLASIYRTDN